MLFRNHWIDFQMLTSLAPTLSIYPHVHYASFLLFNHFQAPFLLQMTYLKKENICCSGERPNRNVKERQDNVF